MRTLFAMVMVKGIFLFLLGVYIAYAACDPITLNTVDPFAMKVATLVTLAGIGAVFGSWLGMDHARLNPKG